MESPCSSAILDLRAHPIKLLAQVLHKKSVSDRGLRFTNSLRTFYPKFMGFRMQSVAEDNRWEVGPNSRMLITSTITLLCTAGVAFYLRFLVALGKECKPRWLARSKHLRPFSGGHSVPMLRTNDKRVARYAALPLTRINLDVWLTESRKEHL